LYSTFFIFKYKNKSCALLYFFEIMETIKPIVGLKLYKSKKTKKQVVMATTSILDITLQYKKASF